VSSTSSSASANRGTKGVVVIDIDERGGDNTVEVMGIINSLTEAEGLFFALSMSDNGVNLSMSSFMNSC
jgi:hypothetical protein